MNRHDDSHRVNVLTANRHGDSHRVNVFTANRHGDSHCVNFSITKSSLNPQLTNQSNINL